MDLLRKPPKLSQMRNKKMCAITTRLSTVPTREGAEEKNRENTSQVSISLGGLEFLGVSCSTSSLEGRKEGEKF